MNYDYHSMISRMHHSLFFVVEAFTEDENVFNKRNIHSIYLKKMFDLDAVIEHRKYILYIYFRYFCKTLRHTTRGLCTYIDTQKKIIYSFEVLRIELTGVSFYYW